MVDRPLAGESPLVFRRLRAQRFSGLLTVWIRPGVDPLPSSTLQMKPGARGRIGH